MKRIRKILSIALAVSLTVSAVTVPTFAGDKSVINDEKVILVTTAPKDVLTTISNDDLVLVSEKNSIGMNNFEQVFEYGDFSDVNKNSWYYNSVKEAFEFGIIKGMNDKQFSPEGNLTLAEAVTMAARIHSIYNGGNGQFIQGTPWYKTYVDYSVLKGILSGENQFSDYNAKATRAQFAEIMVKALPDSELNSINNVESIPDVNSETYAYQSIFKLYNAGILIGNDNKGTFKPDSNITRAEVSAIVVRMALKSERITAVSNENPVEMAKTGYDDIISSIVENIASGWKEDHSDFDFSDCFYFSKEVENYIGFLKKDINGDGIEELMMGEVSHDGMTSPIYDLYSITSDGEFHHVFSGGARNRLYLTKDGTIVNEGSNSAFESFEKAYELKNGKLVEKEFKGDFRDYMNIDFELFINAGKNAGLANPWKECDKTEFEKEMGMSFKVPEGATNVGYMINERIGLGEMVFDLDGLNYVARAQKTDFLRDISGIYADYYDDGIMDCRVGECEGLTKRAYDDENTIDICMWYDEKTGFSYSISTQDKDLDGFDIEAIAEEIF